MKASTSDAKVGAAYSLVVTLPRRRPQRVPINIINHEITVILDSHKSSGVTVPVGRAGTPNSLIGSVIIKHEITVVLEDGINVRSGTWVLIGLPKLGTIWVQKNKAAYRLRKTNTVIGTDFVTGREGIQRSEDDHIHAADIHPCLSIGCACLKLRRKAAERGGVSLGSS
jgi:hypothetical protein